MQRSPLEAATQAQVRVEHGTVLARQAARAQDVARAKAEQQVIDGERRQTEAALALEKALQNLFR